jgi:hypothetical protein
MCIFDFSKLVLFVNADLFNIIIDNMKQGDIIHLAIHRIIGYNNIVINKKNNISSFYISANKLVTQYNTIII